MMRNGPTQHPSGKPIRRNERRGLSQWRVPTDGYVTPRLQKRETSAIGFTVQHLPGTDKLDAEI